MRTNNREHSELREEELGEIQNALDSVYVDANKLYKAVLAELQAAPEHLHGTRRLEGIESATEELKALVEALWEASTIQIDFNW